jgi:hypothetical protein
MDNRKGRFILAEMEVEEKLLFQLTVSLYSSKSILPILNANGWAVF